MNVLINFDQMTYGRTLAMGVDYLFTLLYRVIHTSELTRENFSNSLSTTRFTNLKVLRIERKKVSQRLQECVFLSPNLPDV